MKAVLLLRKGVALGIILLFIGTVSVPLQGQRTEKSVPPTSDGHWLYVGGSGPGNYSRIQDAINEASDGDTVFVYAGMYSENVTVYHTITVLGEDKDRTVIDGYRTDDVVTIVGNGIRFSGFTVRNSSLFEGAGIVVLAHEGSADITNVRVTGNTIGVLLKSGTGVMLHDTTIDNNTETGVYVQASRTELVHNTITNNRLFDVILLAEDVDGTIINNNSITNSQEGIWISDLYPTSHIEITDNIVMNTSTYGVQLGASYSQISGNQFYHNLVAVTLAGGQGNDIRDNTFQNNTRGLWIIGAGGNRVHRNNFIQNHEDAFFTHLVFDRHARNHWYRNYWDTHHLLLPKPIVGQKVLFIPFKVWLNISWVQFDLFPALKPFSI